MANIYLLPSIDSIAGQSLAFLGSVSWPSQGMPAQQNSAQELQSMTFDALRKRCRAARIKGVDDLNTKTKMIAVLQNIESHSELQPMGDSSKYHPSLESISYDR